MSQVTFCRYTEFEQIANELHETYAEAETDADAPPVPPPPALPTSDVIRIYDEMARRSHPNATAGEMLDSVTFEARYLM